MAQIRADEITTLLRQEIENYEGAIDVNRLAADGRRCTQLQARTGGFYLRESACICGKN
jgi:hypothetical protein